MPDLGCCATRKERKGKERKGKERKGKERKGKERKGKERKGKERKGTTLLKIFIRKQDVAIVTR
jgi:hypothetical protein